MAGGKKLIKTLWKPGMLPNMWWGVVGLMSPAWKSGKIEAGMGKRSGSIFMGSQQEFWGPKV